MASSAINRPFKFGTRDRREFVVENSEVALRAENDTNGNPIYFGRARVGTVDGEPKWQIRAIAYDLAEGVTDVTWPENAKGAASADFEFAWTSRGSLTYK